MALHPIRYIAKQKGYDVYEIVKKTHGLMHQDKIWFLFDGEDLTWETVKDAKNKAE